MSLEGCDLVFLQVFYSPAQLAQAVACSYQDTDSAIVGDYRGGGMERAMRCIYKNLDDVIILPEEVVYKYITPNEDLEELVFVSQPEIDRHLTLTATVSTNVTVTVTVRVTVTVTYVSITITVTICILNVIVTSFTSIDIFLPSTININVSITTNSSTVVLTLTCPVVSVS